MNTYINNNSNQESVKSTVFFYFNKYIPNILKALLTNSKINIEEFWIKKDEIVKKHYENLQFYDQYETSFFDIIMMAENGDISKICFLKQIDKMFKDIYSSMALEFQKKLRNIFEGKVFNLKSHNYLSPIGELFCLYKFHFNSTMKVLDIEYKLSDDKPTFDFLVEINQKKYLVEIYNVHPKIEKNDYLVDIENKIIDKLHIKKFNQNFKDYKFFLFPIVWFTDIELSGNNNNNIRNFLNNFKGRYKFDIFGLFSVYKIKYDFGYVFKLDSLNNLLLPQKVGHEVKCGFECLVLNCL